MAMDPDMGTTTYTYDPWSTRLLSILTESPGPVLQDRTYGYTPAGDMQEITDHVAGVTYSYTYDKLHRLMGESTTDSTPATAVEVLTYTYDNEDHVESGDTLLIYCKANVILFRDTHGMNDKRGGIRHPAP